MSIFPNCPINPRDLQPPLRTEKFEALYQLVRIGTICQNLSVLLIYFVDTVDASVLVHLAQQFDVLGCKGWQFLTTEEQRRQLIKDAVRYHRLAGTPQIFCLLFLLLGLDQDLDIFENPCLLSDGTWSSDGEWRADGIRTDNFMIDGVFTLDSEFRNDFRCLVKSWQRASSNFFEPFLPRFADGTWAADGSVVADGRSPNEITAYSDYRNCSTGQFCR